MLDGLLGLLGLLGNLEQALQRKSVWQQGGKVVVEVRKQFGTGITAEVGLAAGW